MGIPASNKMRQPILKYLAKAQKSVKLAVLIEDLAEHFKIPKKELEKRNPSGGKRFASNVGSTVTGLRAAGLLKSPRHSYLEITEAGREGIRNQEKEVTSNKNSDKFIEMTSQIIAAYVVNNAIAPEQLPGIIKSTHVALLELKQSMPNAPKENIAPPPPPHRPCTPLPAVPVEESVVKSHIVCLEDGKKFKSLKKHLAIHHKMSPEQYRKKWGLPPNYPMTAPVYTDTRSKL